VAKQNLLVVDADPRSLRVLEVSLRNAGYNVAGCPSVGKAFEILHTNKPDLILSDTAFADMDGFAFVEQLRQNPEWSDIPFMFLSSDETIESKIRGLELGVQDYLTKPIYIREVIARVGIELARKARQGLAERSGDSKTRFSGSLSEMSVVDLLQTIDVSRKSGVLHLSSGDGDQGMISFDSGAVIHARVDELGGEDAVYRLLLWREGSFDLEFRRVSLVERTVHRTTQALLMEGMRRLDEWSRLSELLPSFDVVLEVDGEVLRERLRETPDDQNDMVRLIDGQRTIGEAIRAHGGDHVDALRKVVDLYFEGIVREVGEVKDSIPILARAHVPVSSIPPKAPVDTIPGPGPKPSLTPLAVPKLRDLPQTELGARSSDLVPTPESLASPEADAPDPGATETWVPASQPPAVVAPASGSEAEELGGWAPAPAPTSKPRPRTDTPRGFQAVQGGGTILNWAGRAPNVDAPGTDESLASAADKAWDRTLDELRDDPDVTEAIAVIDSEPPPGPFVRSSPPPPKSSEPSLDDAFDRETIEYTEPPEVDPPPLTYAQVFEEQPRARPEAPPTLPAGARPRRQAAPPHRSAPAEPSRFVWLAAVALGIAAILYFLRPAPSSDLRAGQPSGEAFEPRAAAPTENAPNPAPRVEPALHDEGAEADALPRPADRDPSSESVESLAEADDGEAADDPEPGIYAKTGVEDTYEAQLALGRRLKRGSRAAAAYRRAIELNPEGSDALAELARLQLGREHTREAAELAERASALDPSNALAWVVLGAARQNRGDRQGARQAYRNCVKLGKGRFVSECRAMLP